MKKHKDLTGKSKRSPINVSSEATQADIDAIMDFADFCEDPTQPGLGVLDYYDVTDEIFHSGKDMHPEEDDNAASNPFVNMPGVQLEIPEPKKINGRKLPVVRLSFTVGTPFVPMALPQTFEENAEVVEKAANDMTPVILLFQDMKKYEKGSSKGLSRYGVWANVMRIIPPEDNNSPEHILTISGPRLKVDQFFNRKGDITASVHVEPWIAPTDEASEIKLAAMFHELCDRYDEVRKLEGNENAPKTSSVLDLKDEQQILGTLLFGLSVSPEKKNSILCMQSVEEVVMTMLSDLSNLKQLLELRRDINNKVNKRLENSQRESFIMNQIELLQNEVGLGAASDVENLSARAKGKVWNEETQSHFERELAKLRRLSPSTPDYSIQYSYLDTFLNLPWQNSSELNHSLENIENILNEDHFGLERVKERILEQMAVASLRKDNQSPILCLVGPPGVGKTSLGKSIARAMGREYARVAFGGLHDEAEIRGHRRTYIGAMPGRIISALLKTKFNNPVIVLDEIDKIGKDFKGDPSTALLEVLDPEQNFKFHDNYIDADYDLSRILFIATANSLETVSGPLRDRMEIISIPGYITAEKVEIAKRHLITKQLEANGLKDENITFSDDALIYLIEYYTRESGVRKLEKTIGKILRKIAVKKVRGLVYPKSISRKLASELLGKEEYNPEMYENNDSIGVVTGLAWTQVGGEILFIESSITQGKGQLTLTGNLGDVMKESATLALQYLKAHASNLGLEQEIFDTHDVHIHVPEGAIPKDGPSAGITMATSLASSFTGKKVRPKLAMTGEITLRGKVLPVGGIKEKIIAAKRAGITDIILSKENEKDIKEIKPEYLEGLTFFYVYDVLEVISKALVDSE